MTVRPDLRPCSHRPGSAAPHSVMRRVVTTASLTAVVTLGVVPASWASTQIGDGTTSGVGLSAWQTLALYAGAPAALAVIIAVLVMAPSWVRGPRYRPTLTWWAAPVWFNPPAAVANVTPLGEPASDQTLSPIDGGGASARW